MKQHTLRFMLLLAIFLITATSIQAQKPAYWSDEPSQRTEGESPRMANFSRPLQLDFSSMKAMLDKAPDEYSVIQNAGIVIELPLPYGGFEKFRVLSTEMMEDGLKRNAVGMKTFVAVGIDDPGAIGRLDYTPLGFR